MGSGCDASSENSGESTEGDDEQEGPHPPPLIAEEVFSSIINSMPRTKEKVEGWCSGIESDEDENVGDDPVQRNLKLDLLPSTTKELYNRIKILHCQFLRHGKYENSNDLVSLLSEMLRGKFITQEDYQKTVDTLGYSDGRRRRNKRRREWRGSIEKIARVYHGLFSWA